MATAYIIWNLGNGIEGKWIDYDYQSGNELHATEFIIEGSGDILYVPGYTMKSHSSNYNPPLGSRPTGNFDVVDIPETITGFPNTGTSRGFVDGWYANTINIGSQVTSIPSHFVYTNMALNYGIGGGVYYIRFPNGCNVLTVGEEAFRTQSTYALMRSLIEIDLNDNIQSFGRYCFYRCNLLEKFSLHNIINGTVDEGAFYYNDKLINIEFGNNAQVDLSHNTFLVNQGQGPGYTGDNKLITYATGNQLIINSIDWDSCNRYVEESGILRLGHMGQIVKINGYSSGIYPFEHLGHRYWLRECQNGDANQSPLVIKHNGTIHYISK